MFNVLAASDNKTNFDLLLRIFELEENSNGGSIYYDDLVDSFVSYFHSQVIESLDDEDGNDISKKNSRDKAASKIRQFRKCDWLEEGSSDLFKARVGLTANGRAFLRFFKDFLFEQEKPLAYTGYIFTVWTVLKNFDFSQGASLVQHCFFQTQRLMSELSRLSSQIKRYLNELTESTSTDPKSILDTLIFKYQKQFIYRNFHNLLTLDNPSKYTTDILSVLSDLLYINFDRLMDNYLKVNGIEKMDSLSLKLIEDELKTQLTYMIHQYETIFERVKEVDEANSRYVSSAQNRLDFILNTAKDVSGRIKNALKLLSKVDEEYEFSNLIHLYSCQNVDYKSLYAPRFNKEKEVMVEEARPITNEEDIDRGMDIIFGEDEYSVENMDDKIKQILSETPQITAENLQMGGENELIQLMLVQLYSSNPSVCYDIDFSSKEYEKNEHIVKSFTLKKKENSYE